MLTSNAKLIKVAIQQKYQHKGTYYPPKSDDISNHLQSNNIDPDVASPHQHNGFDEANDGSLIIFHYADKSVLIVSSTGIEAPY